MATLIREKYIGSQHWYVFACDTCGATVHRKRNLEGKTVTCGKCREAKQKVATIKASRRSQQELIDQFAADVIMNLSDFRLQMSDDKRSAMVIGDCIKGVEECLKKYRDETEEFISSIK